MKKPLGAWKRRNEEIKRTFRIVVHACRRAGFKGEEIRNNVVCYSKPEIKIALRMVDETGIDPEIIIKHWR